MERIATCAVLYAVYPWAKCLTCVRTGIVSYMKCITLYKQAPRYRAKICVLSEWHDACHAPIS